MTSSKKQNTVLLVDGNTERREEIRRHLEQCAYDTVCAASQSEAEEWIAKQPFDLLITALILEYADSGFLICHRFRRACPNAHAILLSDVAAKSGIEFDLSADNAREWIHADAILNHTIRMEQLDSLLARFSS